MDMIKFNSATISTAEEEIFRALNKLSETCSNQQGNDSQMFGLWTGDQGVPAAMHTTKQQNSAFEAVNKSVGDCKNALGTTGTNVNTMFSQVNGLWGG